MKTILKYLEKYYKRMTLGLRYMQTFQWVCILQENLMVEN